MRSATQPTPWSNGYGHIANDNVMPGLVNQSAQMDVPVTNIFGGEYALPDPAMNQDMSNFWFWNYALPEWQLNPEDLGLPMPGWDVAGDRRDNIPP